MRIRFRKGEQRVFLDMVILKLRAVSLRGLLQFGFDVKYSTLKNYYGEVRLMPKGLVEDFCEVSGVSFDGLDTEEIGENWGQRLGGMKGK